MVTPPQLNTFAQQPPILPSDIFDSLLLPTQDTLRHLNNPYYPGLATGGMGLQALSDPPPGKSPGYPKRVLIRAAIEGSPEKKLRLKDICAAVEQRFEYYRTVSDKDDKWRATIRHNLSNNVGREFCLLSKPANLPGKGKYWGINPNPSPRPVKKRPKGKGRARSASVELDGGAGDDGDDGVSGLVAGPSASPRRVAGPRQSPRTPRTNRNLRGTLTLPHRTTNNPEPPLLIPSPNTAHVYTGPHLLAGSTASALRDDNSLRVPQISISDNGGLEHHQSTTSGTAPIWDSGLYINEVSQLPYEDTFHFSQQGPASHLTGLTASTSNLSSYTTEQQLSSSFPHDLANFPVHSEGTTNAQPSWNQWAAASNAAMAATRWSGSITQDLPSIHVHSNPPFDHPATEARDQRTIDWSQPISATLELGPSFSPSPYNYQSSSSLSVLAPGSTMFSPYDTYQSSASISAIGSPISPSALHVPPSPYDVTAPSFSLQYGHMSPLSNYPWVTTPTPSGVNTARIPQTPQNFVVDPILGAPEAGTVPDSLFPPYPGGFLSSTPAPNSMITTANVAPPPTWYTSENNFSLQQHSVDLASGSGIDFSGVPSQSESQAGPSRSRRSRHRQAPYSSSYPYHYMESTGSDGEEGLAPGPRVGRF